MYTVENDDNKVYEYNLSTPFNIGTASFSNNFDVSNLSPSLSGMEWNNDGSKMYIVDDDKTLYEYSVSSAFDISTASVNNSISVKGEASLAWNNDGSKLFMTDNIDSNVYQYSLSTSFDISSLSFTKEYDLSGQTSFPFGLAWNNDGSKMYVADNDNDNVLEYNTTNFFDIGSLSFNKSFDVSGQSVVTAGVSWNNDGSKMYIVDSNNSSIFQYNVSTPFDVGTASYSTSFSVVGGSPRAMSWLKTS
jgi:sugar lactone lactonase YvrE